MAIVDYENLPSTNTPLTGGVGGNLRVMQEQATTHGSSTKLGYAQSFLNDKIVNIGTVVDGTYNTNLIKGKNLFDKNNFQELNAYFNDSTTTITSNSSNRTLYMKCKANTTYSITIEDASKTGAYYLGYTTQMPTIGTQVYGITTEKLITTGNNATYLVLRYFHTSNATITKQQALDSIQIEEGNESTTYEEFVPNSINVDGYKFTETIGIGESIDSTNRVNVLHSRNLLEVDLTKYPTTTYSGVTNTYNGNQSITLNGTQAQNGNLYLLGNASNIITTLKAGKTYTLKLYVVSGSLTGVGNFIMGVVGDANYRYSSISTTSESVVNTFTPATDVNVVSLRIYATGAAGITYSNLVLKFEINEGIEALPYEPYVVPSIVVDNDEIYNSGEFAFFYKKIVKPTDGANFNYLLDEVSMGTIYISELGTTKYYIGTFNKVSGQNPVFNMIGNNGITISASNSAGTVVLSGATTNSNLRVCIIGCQINFPI